jgi:hypothetical protein
MVLVLSILKMVAAAATLATGLYALVRPTAVYGFTGLEATGPRGITEIRSVLGGAFIGLGIVTLVLRAAPAYQTLGAMYLAIAAVRLVSIFLDRSAVPSNWVSLAVEVVLGMILVV